MTDSTFATVAIAAADQAAAQIDLPGLFTAAYTTNPEGKAPATHYVSSGLFFNDELDMIVNDATWPRQVRFGDAGTALAGLGLFPVLDPSGAAI